MTLDPTELYRRSLSRAGGGGKDGPDAPHAVLWYSSGSTTRSHTNMPAAPPGSGRAHSRPLDPLGARALLTAIESLYAELGAWGAGWGGGAGEGGCYILPQNYIKLKRVETFAQRDVIVLIPGWLMIRLRILKSSNLDMCI